MRDERTVQTDCRNFASRSENEAQLEAALGWDEAFVPHSDQEKLDGFRLANRNNNYFLFAKRISAARLPAVDPLWRGHVFVGAP